jgi:hypothetical protein
MLEAGEGIADITPPLGIELAGFHRPPGQERRITGIRQPASARALLVRTQKASVCLLSLEVCGVPADFVKRVQRRVAQATGVPAANVRVCATHTHAMPTLRFFRQWGAVSRAYSKFVEDRTVSVATQAKRDLAPADFYLGKERVTGGNFNRTAKTWKTEADFTDHSTDAERWLDRTLHALYFLRAKPRPDILWFHFSAHPVCFGDTLASPDWPGLVSQKMRERDGLSCAFLQGHVGDVNPGDGAPWTGDAERVSEAVWSALHHAVNHSAHVPVDEPRVANGVARLPLDLTLLDEELAQYRQDPSKCTSGTWVDAGFAKDWFDSLSKWNRKRTHLPAPLSAVRLGSVGLLFHPAELYSFYGLAIRSRSPFPDTLVVGYADDFVGYLTDPKAYQAQEYAALVVPKILDLPPFKPEAAKVLAEAAVLLLGKLG